MNIKDFNGSNNTYRLTITPQLAAKWLAVSAGACLDIDDNVAKSYAETMRHGCWRLTGDSVKIDTGGRVKDGQHRLKACVLAGTTFETLVAIVCTEAESVAVRPVPRQVPNPATEPKGEPFKKPVNWVSIASAVRAYLHLTDYSRWRKQCKIPESAVVKEYSGKKELYDLATREGRRIYGRVKAINVSTIASAVVYLSHDKGYSPESVILFFEKTCDELDRTSDTINALRDFLKLKMPPGRAKHDDTLVRKAMAYSFEKWSQGIEMDRIVGMYSTSIRDWKDVRSCSCKQDY